MSKTRLFEDCEEDKLIDYHSIYGSICLSSEFNAFVVICEDWPSFLYASKVFGQGLGIFHSMENQHARHGYSD